MNPAGERIGLIKKIGLDVESEGSSELLGRMTHSFMLSHQARRPGPQDWWVHAAREAARWAALRGSVAIAGGGLLHLDFMRWAAHSFGPVIWLDVGSAIKAKTIGAGSAPDRWSDLRLEAKPDSRITKRELLFARDRAIADISDFMVAIVVRKGGVMERIGKDAIASGKKVFVLEPPFKTKEYAGNFRLLEKGARPLPIEIPIPATTESSSVSQSVSCPLPPASYLWHFTRECSGPWPGQTWGDYFSELANGTPGSGHSPLDGLRRILVEERIRASGRMIRGGFPVVSWSGATPGELVAQRKYRSALIRWDFQPYAVGIKRDVAKKLGLKPVLYQKLENYPKIPEGDRYLYQAISSGAKKWTEEEEWRNMGDFQLTDIHPSEGVALVDSPDERDAILPFSRFPVISLRDGGI